MRRRGAWVAATAAACAAVVGAWWSFAGGPQDASDVQPALSRDASSPPADLGLPDGALGREASAYELSAPVEDAARELLGTYRDKGGCVPTWAGYLDLAGNVWACEIAGDGWVDVCLVSGTEAEGRCAVRVWRLDEAWATEGEGV